MEKIESKSGSEEIFHSDYGIKFQMQYEELLEYISVGSIIPATINFYQPINELLSNPTKIKDYFIELLTFVKAQHDLSEKQTGKLDEISTKVENQVDKMIDLGMHEIQVLNSILKDFNSVLKNKTIPKEIEDDVQETDIQELIQRISALQRINAYFIMSLYALIDFYTKGLIIELTSIISQERAYKYSQKMPKASKNPVNAIKLVINELDLIHPDTRKTLDEIIKTKQWQIHKEAFNNLKEIRHTTAHQIPIISYKTLCENFPYYQETVLKQLGELRGEFKNMQFPSFWEKSIDTFVKDLKTALFLREIGNGIFCYLGIIEGVVQFYLNKE